MNTTKESDMFYLKNLPLWERLLRLAAGIVLAVYAYKSFAGSWAWVVVAVAVVLVLTGLIGFCPACALAGRRLAKRNSALSE
jgi:hypothetical protein